MNRSFVVPVNVPVKNFSVGTVADLIANTLVGCIGRRIPTLVFWFQFHEVDSVYNYTCTVHAQYQRDEHE